MNVSVSVDWRRTPLDRLDGHRFIARTRGGQVLDGWFVYEASWDGGVCFDRDFLTCVLTQKHGLATHLVDLFLSINVLDETYDGRRVIPEPEEPIP